MTATTKHFPWGVKGWHERAILIAKFIPKGSKILDLGSGTGYLTDYMELPKDKFTAIDIEKWTEDTIVADFNKGQYPDVGTHDVIVAQGIMEYLVNKGSFLKEIQKYGDHLIATYRFNKNIKTYHRNKASQEDIINLIEGAGWKIERIIDVPVNAEEKMYICKK